jgi:hypothetical protein
VAAVLHAVLGAGWLVGQGALQCQVAPMPMPGPAAAAQVQVASL